MVMRFGSRWAFGCLLLAGAMVLRADAAKPVLEQTAKDGQPAVTFCDKTVVVGSGKNVSLVEDPLDGRTAVRLAAGGRAVFSLGEGGPARRCLGEGGTLLFWLKPAWMPCATGYAAIDNHTKRDGTYAYDAGCEHGRLRVLGFDKAADADVLLTGSYVMMPGTTELRNGKNIFPGIWTCLAVSWRKDRAETYAFEDGMLYPGHSRHGWGRAKPLDVKDLVFGSTTRHPGFEGDIAFVKVWDRPLTPDELKAEYAKVQPVALELEDYAVAAGRPSRLRLRVFNLTDRALERSVRLTLDGKDYAQTAFLAAGGAADLVYTVTVAKPGVCRLDTNENRAFEIAAIDMSRNVTAEMAGGEVNWKLVETFDATKDNPREKMLAEGTHVVRKPSGAYRESASSLRAAWCWKPEIIAHPDRWHVLEVEYPDDARRHYAIHVFAVNPRTGGITGGQMESIGILTGGLHPNTYRPQKKRLMFRPESDRIEVIVETSAFTDAYSRGSAASVFRIYEADCDLLPALGALPGERTSGVWDEDPTMDCEWFGRTNFKAKHDLDFWRVKAERIVEYARFMGHNRWTVQIMDYQGDRNGSGITLPSSTTRGYHGHIDGWVDLYAKVFERENLPWCGRLGKTYNGKGFYDDLVGKAEADRLRMLPGDATKVENFQQIDPALPETVAAMRRLVAHYRDKYADSPTFLGVSFDSHNLLHYFGPNYGYGDATIALFEKEMGVEVPEMPREMRGAYLMGADAGRGRSPSGPQEFGGDELRDKWIAWRCKKVCEYARALAEEFRRGNDRLVIKAYVFPSQMYHHSRQADWNIDLELRKRGIDFAALNRIPGFEVIPYDSPDEEVTHTFGRPWGKTELFGRQTYSPDTLGWIAARQKTPACNFVAHANMESYDAGNAKLPECHYPLGYYGWDESAKKNCGFASWTSAFPNEDEALMPWTSWLANADVKEIVFGFWGMPEMGVQERFRRFYRAYRSIPKGDYRLVNDPKDPVAIRASGDDWFMVNKESFAVKVSDADRGRSPSGPNSAPREWTLGPCEVVVMKGGRPESFVETWDEAAVAPYRRVALALKNADSPLKGDFAAALDAHDFATVRRLLLTPDCFEVVKDMKPFTAEARWRADDRTIEVSLDSGTAGSFCHFVTLEAAEGSVWASGKDAQGKPEKVEVWLKGGETKRILLHPSKYPTKDGEEGVMTVVVTRSDKHVETFPFKLGGAFAYYDAEKATVGDDWSFARYRLRSFHADPPDPNHLGIAFDWRAGWLWNERGLFLAVEVDEDDKDVVLPEPGKGWGFGPVTCDSLQLFFSCNAGAPLDKQGFGDEDIECLFYQPLAGDYFGRITRYSKYARWYLPIESQRHRKDGKVTQWEVHIPAEQLAGVRMGANTVITACVLVNNRFERRDLWQRLGTSCNFVPYANPGTWPTLTFVGKEK